MSIASSVESAGLVEVLSAAGEKASGKSNLDEAFKSVDQISPDAVNAVS